MGDPRLRPSNIAHGTSQLDGGLLHKLLPELRKGERLRIEEMSEPIVKEELVEEALLRTPGTAHMGKLLTQFSEQFNQVFAYTCFNNAWHIQNYAYKDIQANYVPCGLMGTPILLASAGARHSHNFFFYPDPNLSPTIFPILQGSSVRGLLLEKALPEGNRSRDLYLGTDFFSE